MLTTSVDEIAVLFMFYHKQNKQASRHLVTFLYLLASSILTLMAIITTLGIQLFIPQNWMGWLGILPILLGLQDCFSIEEAQPVIVKGKSIFTMLSTFFALGMDDIMMYVPVLSNNSVSNWWPLLLAFLLVALLICYLALELVRFKQLTGYLDQYENQLEGTILIMVGLRILWQSGILQNVL
ncbi:cadmium resistance transporter [Facklamia sp. DSM 111018]|uniref:Cadmium resistance transporter n=1 Tax=Facklamia lactis TaxID=2749967 RepID=A0ABS0LSM7_9LACT|nr:cadmium resistance transporter [Facklamia lactis]MBG9981363.1 cadmium resistance transporter [Facklamia lactis]MBG9987161.1 cadmium resistance transporter [Facklamia lactis]